MAWYRQKGREAIAAVVVTFCLACSSDGPSGTTGSIQVVANPTTLSVPQGGTGSVTIALTRSGGFSGAVTLAIAGLPAGVTTTVTPAQLSGVTAGATIAVAVASTVPVGNYSATVTASGQGVGAATASYQLTVTPASDYA